MPLISKFRHAVIPFALLVFISLVLEACSTGVQAPQSGQPTSLPTPTLVAKSEETTSSPRGTLTAIPSNTPEKSKATPILTLESLEIESGDPRYVSKAFWSDDGKIVYYAFAQSGGARPLEWATYDLATRSTTIISSPLKYDPRIWKRLNVPEPDPSGLYIELQGYVSPSGRRVIYTIPIDDSKPPKSEVWVADTETLSRRKLMEVPNYGGIYDAIWLEDETKIVFRYGVETNDLYVADFQNGNGRPIADISDFKDGIGDGWSASPNGTTIAATDFQRARLWLISLEDGKAKLIDAPVTYVHWSKDGKTLYYDWGISSADIQEFRSYNIVSGKTSTLITHSQVKDIYFLNDFAVSPSGDKVLFWGGWLRQVELRK